MQTVSFLFCHRFVIYGIFIPNFRKEPNHEPQRKENGLPTRKHLPGSRSERNCHDPPLYTKPDHKGYCESLLSKLRLLSDKECMDLVKDVQKNYRLPDKARTIGEPLAEARQKSGAEKLSGHDCEW